MFQQVAPILHGTLLSEADPDYHQKLSSLPPAQQAALAAAQKNAKLAMEEVEKSTGIIGDSIIAKYKIEILFGPKRTMTGPNVVRIGLWESGTKLHGGGDASLFFCKDGTVDHGAGCWAPILPRNVRGAVAYCNACNGAINSSKLTVHKEGYIKTKTLAAEVARLFRTLDNSADLYCKFNRDDIHYISMLRQHGKAKAEKLLGLHIYPLKNMLKDIAAGATVESRVYAFITS